MSDRPLRLGIICHPSVGGSGILASELGEELAGRGHEAHFISHAAPFRMPRNHPRIHFHPVQVNDYDLFKYPDYTLPLSVKIAEVMEALFGPDLPFSAVRAELGLRGDGDRIVSPLDLPALRVRPTADADGEPAVALA